LKKVRKFFLGGGGGWWRVSEVSFLFYFILFIYFYMLKYSSNKKSHSLPKILKTYTIRFTCHTPTNYALMCLWQFKIKTSNSQMPKVSNKTLEIPTIRSCVQHSKLINEIQIIVSRWKMLGVLPVGSPGVLPILRKT
jgi:hypothetical protein